MSEISEMRAEVQKCLQWSSANANAFAGSSSTLEAQIAAKQAEMLAFQQGKLREALASTPEAAEAMNKGNE